MNGGSYMGLHVEEMDAVPIKGEYLFIGRLLASHPFHVEEARSKQRPPLEDGQTFSLGK